MWDVEYTDEFGDWWDTLTEEEQIDVRAPVFLLQQEGPNLRFPYSSSIQNSKHGHMRELRAQHKGNPFRIFYAFDPRRCAILLIGGDKTGDDHWYDRYIPIADKLYDDHINILKTEKVL